MARGHRKLDGSWSGGKGSFKRKNRSATAKLVAELGERLFWEKDTLSAADYAALEAEFQVGAALEGELKGEGPDNMDTALLARTLAALRHAIEVTQARGQRSAAPNQRPKKGPSDQETPSALEERLKGCAVVC